MFYGYKSRAEFSFKRKHQFSRRYLFKTLAMIPGGNKQVWNNRKRNFFLKNLLAGPLNWSNVSRKWLNHGSV